LIKHLRVLNGNRLSQEAMWNYLPTIRIDAGHQKKFFP